MGAPLDLNIRHLLFAAPSILAVLAIDVFYIGVASHDVTTTTDQGSKVAGSSGNATGQDLSGGTGGLGQGPKRSGNKV